MKYNFDEPLDRTGSDSLKWAKGVLTFAKDDVIPMWVADMDFPCPPAVVDAIKARAAHPAYGYSYINMSLCQAIVEHLERKYRWRVEPQWLLFTPGVVPALRAAVRTYTKPGDGIVVQPPVYPPFMSAAAHDGRRIVYNPLRFFGNAYSMDFDDLEAKLSQPSTRMLILCNPHNPVGRVWTEQELVRVGELALKNDVLVLSDEIHGELVFKGRRHIPMAGLTDEFARNTLTCISPSKAFNLAGLSAAVVIVPDAELRRRFLEATEGTMGDINVFGLKAMEVAYREGEEWLMELLLYLEENSNVVCRFFAEKIPEIRPVEPEGTYLMWLDCRELGLDSGALVRAFQEGGVGLMSGSAFGPGGEGFLRINIACPRSLLVEALRRMEAVVDGLRAGAGNKER